MMNQKAEKTNCYAKGSGSMKRTASKENPCAHGSNSMKSSGPGKISKAVDRTERK